MKDRRMSFAGNKTKTILLSDKKKHVGIQFSLKDEILPLKKLFKYLGFIMNGYLSFKRHVEQVIGQGN